MRVSEYFKLERTQPTLDFVDVDVVGDLPVYIDPRALRLVPDEWADECVSLIKNFFCSVLDAIKSEQHAVARSLLSSLREPNETHLGLSRRKARGRAMGSELSTDVWESLCKSEAVHTGLLEDLEDTVLMVEGIASDIVSDITTNIIRSPLIAYTQAVSEAYGIPLTPDVDSGPMWDPNEQDWYSEFVSLPIANNNKLILVPKAIVRQRLDFNSDEYYRHYLLEYLREQELSANTELVRLLRGGRRKVYKKDVIEKYGRGKAMIVRETRRNPQVLERYRSEKQKHIHAPLTHRELAESSNTQLPEWSSLLQAVKDVPIGQQGATQFHRAIEKLLSVLFYPLLTNPQCEYPIHEGRKRIDITYTNVAQDGFFGWLSLHFPASHVYVECKNYKEDQGNRELDQLAGRFSPSRGRFGILVCRNLIDRDLFIRRCRDTATDDRGFIVPLDEHDLTELVEQRQDTKNPYTFALLKDRFDKLVM